MDEDPRLPHIHTQKRRGKKETPPRFTIVPLSLLPLPISVLVAGGRVFSYEKGTGKGHRRLAKPPSLGLDEGFRRRGGGGFISLLKTRTLGKEARDSGELRAGNPRGKKISQYRILLHP